MVITLPSADPLLDQRPMSSPPIDRRHQFFTLWQVADAPEVIGWVTHFTRVEVPFIQVFRDGCHVVCWKPHHHVYRWTMLYVHHLLTPRRVTAPSRWCCRK